MSHPLILAISGASGAVYATRLLEVLIDQGLEVHLTISPAAAIVLEQELNISVDLDDFRLQQLLPSHEAGNVRYFHYRDFLSPMASGPARTRGMVICPCSGGTLSAIAHAASNNLIHRAADVHLKERRKLILVPRETPLSTLQLENMLRVSQAGAVVLPAMPGWYHGVSQLSDLVDFVVARILDQLEIDHPLTKRWGDEEGTSNIEH